MMERSRDLTMILVGGRSPMVRSQGMRERGVVPEGET